MNSDRREFGAGIPASVVKAYIYVQMFFKLYLYKCVFGCFSFQSCFLGIWSHMMQHSIVHQTIHYKRIQWYCLDPIV